MVTINDVARSANVSKKTVSRVINNNPNVAAQTRAHVQRVIDELGYQPNVIARGLAQGRANAIGVVIAESARAVFAYPLYNDILYGIAQVLNAEKIDMLVRLDRQDPANYLDLYLQRRVDGLILASMSVDDRQLPRLFQSDAPYVLTQRVLDYGADTWWVDVDFEAGARQAAAHLLDLGHRQIAFLVGPANKSYTRLLLRGHRTALQERGLSIQDDFILTSPPYTGVEPERIAAIMKHPHPPTAFVCSDDMKAVQLLQILQAQGYRIPEDVSVIGSDDTVIAQYANPPLTTIHQDAVEKGRLAATILLKRMHNVNGQAPAQVLLPTRLIVRGTTGPAPAS